MRHAAALRIDHVLGFVRQFWVPRGAEGSDGAYVSFPLDALIAVTAIESRRQQLPGGRRGPRHRSRWPARDGSCRGRILSYRVLWFERDGSGLQAARRSIRRMALACLASHDLPTFSRLARGPRHRDCSRARPDRRADAVSARKAARGGGDAPARCAVAGCVERLAAMPPPRHMASIASHALADDAGAGRRSRRRRREPLNVPGTDREWPNWRRRLLPTVDRLAATPLAQAIIARVKAERGT